MYPILHQILSDKPDGVLFRCFGGWHIGYMALFAVLAGIVLYTLRNKSEAARSKTADLFVGISFGLYVLDFFLMPLAYGEIDIEKLPFHICTAMCVMCFLSRRVEKLKPYTVTFGTLGFLSNLGYLIYPAGLMWHQTHPLSYRVLETLLFHGFMAVYGLLVLVYEAKPDSYKDRKRDLTVIVCMVLWALLGNLCYNGERFYNWFFVVRDPFYILPEAIAKFVMPPFNILLFFAAQMLVYKIISIVKRPPKH
ncbi:MAG: YwaF family protein [Oscillospiraceae bacterium]|nr:YwaF family protein [Oscillospiraceae bacterium]